MSELLHKLEELRVFLQENSIRRGTFTLASGMQTPYYCDTKATTLSPAGSRLVGEVLFGLLRDCDAEAVGGLALGATYVAAAVALISGQRGHPLYGYTVREERKGHGLLKEVEESAHPDGQPLLSPGRRVAVVDDVVTGGGSIQKAIDTVRSKGCEIVAVVAIVDRRAGGGERLLSEGLPYLALFETDESGTLHANVPALIHRATSEPARVGALR
ncbi:MAG TPA: orotate phosphoribosyltransferase [Thermoanaerobaculia bacterium]